MKRFSILSGLCLGVALIGPGMLSAQERSTTTTTTTETKRYYDPVEKDYHAWNDREDRAYHTYIQEEHRDYVEFPKVTTRQRTEYFRWRHKHPDSVIFKSETEERH